MSWKKFTLSAKNKFHSQAKMSSYHKSQKYMKNISLWEAFTL